MISALKTLLRSFGYAFTGFRDALKTEANLRWHLAFAVLAIGFGIWLQISALEWIAITLCVGAVISAELLNTSLERLADRITKEKDELIRQSKDISAAGVTVLALMAVIVGVIIFLPKLWTRFFG
ncbi:MAG: undecaprenol kinase [Verrucomicrobiales bacterium]